MRHLSPHRPLTIRRGASLLALGYVTAFFGALVWAISQ